MATYFVFDEEPDVDRSQHPPAFFYPPTGQWLVRDIHDGVLPLSETTIALNPYERDEAVGPKVLVNGELVPLVTLGDGPPP